MRLELYRGSIKTLATWVKGDSLPQWMARYTQLLERRGLHRFMPERAAIVGPRGGVRERWTA